MKAAAVLDGTIRVIDATRPEPAPGQLLVRVEACGICGSDLSLVRDPRRFTEVSTLGGNALSAFDPERAVVPGHEFAGTVVRTGSADTGFADGDRVTGIGIVTDRESGDLTIIGYSNDYPGAFSQEIIVDATWARPIPEGMSFEVASLAEPLHVGETHVQQSGWKPEIPALVIGAGAVGLGVIAALSLRGATELTVVEPSPRRRELALALGATRAVPPPNSGGPAAALPEQARTRPVTAFECSGRQGALEELTRTLPHSSHLQVVSSPFREETFVPVIAQWRQLVINFGSGPVDDPYGVTLERLATGQIDPSLFITGRVDLEGVAEAFTALGNPEEHVKILVLPNA
ncbi:alcohol dehydrogenase catalytic domain-containing protein [Arthrobacter sp. BHU FT2]|nr:alcohol dehydrogenase catalytic domain-containing protein [Arthrobacter sp. BHU FT2]